MTETNEKTFPCDSEEVNGEPDITYVSDDFARYFRTFISSGIFLKESTNLQVIANGDMTVTLMPGSAIIDGYRYDNPEEIIIQLTPADGVLNRIDRISVTWSAEDGDIHYTVQEGIPSYQPYTPNCRRTADYKDYVVADVYVGAGAVSIKQGDITDTRLNSELCGLAIAFCDIDTTTIFNQFESWFQEIRATGELSYENLLKIFGDYTEEYQQRFLKWFADMKDQLSEDAAGNLQNQINDLDSRCRKMVGDEFSIEKEYEIGDYCIYNNTVYKFTKTKEAGEWDSDIVQATTLQKELSELNGNLTDSSTGIGFKFGVDADGNYGYIKAGADTVIPFSAGSAAELYEALQYSGLVTPDMTFEEMCAALSAYWPAILYLCKGGSLFYSTNNPNPTYFTITPKTDYVQFYDKWVSGSGHWSRLWFENKFHFKDYKTLKFEVSATVQNPNPADYNYINIRLNPDKGTSSDLKSFNLLSYSGKGKMSLSIDISNITADGYIGIDFATQNGYTQLDLYEMELLV